MDIHGKIKEIVKKNGIKSFGYKLQDLKIFNNEEIQTLCNMGLISNKHRTMIIDKMI